MKSDTTYRQINSPELCMICSQPPETVKDGNSTRTLKLIKHHVKYNPETILWTHYKCHQKIHDTDKPMIQFIQYTDNEKKEFYKNKKQGDKTLGTIVKWKL